jgi:hypothetical protein
MTFGIIAADSTPMDNLDQWLQERSVMQDLVKQHLNRAQLRMKHQADKGRTEREFQEGDHVFLKIQPYVQSSVAPRANHKLTFKYFGPFSVLHRVGKVAYRLALSQSLSIHPVFHVSQLKKVVGKNVQVSSLLSDSLSALQVLKEILQRRIVSRGNHSMEQLLIHWSNSPVSLATWVDLEALHRRFPRAPAWGQAVPKRGEGGEGMSRFLCQEQLKMARVKAFKWKKWAAERPNPRIIGPEWYQ